ncbi:MAG: hypothetical protein ACXV5H_08340 [Halobacteriota archaeon]
MQEITLNQVYSETPDFFEIDELKRLRELLSRAIDEAALRYEHKYLAPSLLPYVIAHMVHKADPSFSETLVQAEFNKSALEFTEQLDRATRGRFTLSHVWKK